MSEKRCSTCRSVLPLDAFAVSRTARDGRQSRCRGCWRTWYAENRDQHVADVERRRAAVRARHQEAVTAHLREHPCADCGEADLRVLDFDHEDPREKGADVARLIAMHVSWERVAAEIAKCTVRCANCHRRRTAAQLGYWRHDAELRRREALAAAATARLEALVGSAATMERPLAP